MPYAAETLIYREIKGEMLAYRADKSTIVVRGIISYKEANLITEIVFLDSPSNNTAC